MFEDLAGIYHIFVRCYYETVLKIGLHENLWLWFGKYQWIEVATLENYFKTWHANVALLLFITGKYLKHYNVKTVLKRKGILKLPPEHNIVSTILKFQQMSSMNLSITKKYLDRILGILIFVLWEIENLSRQDWENAAWIVWKMQGIQWQ